MQAYNSLSTFPDVEQGLEIVSSDPSISAYVFSQGDKPMVHASVHDSPSLSPHAHVFENLITIEEVKVFKPDPKVYEYLAEKVGKKGDLGNVWLVSGNPFDVVGARAFGLQAAWVNRAKDKQGRLGSWNDGVGGLIGGAAGEGPTVVVDGVKAAVEAIKKWAEKQDTDTKGKETGGAGNNFEGAAMGPG
jgi:2-haloacid dehalogenase